MGPAERTQGNQSEKNRMPTKAPAKKKTPSKKVTPKKASTVKNILTKGNKPRAKLFPA